MTIIWGAPSYRVAFEAIGANAHLQGAVAEELMKEISEAVTRVETQAKAKRKEEATWGDLGLRSPVVGALPLPKIGNLVRQPVVKETGMATRFRPRLGSKARAGKARTIRARAIRARAIKARANRILLLAILLLLLVGMLLLFRGLAGLVPTSVPTAGSKDTTRTRAPNLPLRTRSGILDGRYWSWPVLQPVHPQGERT